MAQVIHISGQLDWETIQTARASLTSEQKKRYHAFPYLHEEMGAALVSADLVISRAGASTLGEFPFLWLARDSRPVSACVAISKSQCGLSGRARRGSYPEG